MQYIFLKQPVDITYLFLERKADKLFVAMDNKVRAFTRKGKLFLSFDLNLTETIKSMYGLR